MFANHSPWIHQLKRTRPVVPIAEDRTTDVAIVGGGIAGAMTAYFTLRDTEKSVTMLEADKVAHGATGHNAGQISSYFERPFCELVEEFGLLRASEGQRDVENAWMLIDEILSETGLSTPVYRFTGYAGCATLDQVLLHLRNNRLRMEGGLQPESITVSKNWEGLKDIPEEYTDLYTLMEHDDLLTLLNTKNPAYIAALSFQKGCMNSATFSEELIGYLLATYPDRFSLYEESPVSTVSLKEDEAVLTACSHTVTARNVVLCTNGFEYFTLKNEVGEDIDTSFHHLIVGRIGYMAGYLEPMSAAPTAISYFPPAGSTFSDPTGESYFYLTRRPHEEEGSTAHNLICAGGPEAVLPNQALYERGSEVREDMHELIDGFLRQNYHPYPNDEVTYSFTWHGLMGYTPNGVRRIGYEPKNPVLLYNLGCNGVGILPSIHGGKRISQFLKGESLPASIFDPW